MQPDQLSSKLDKVKKVMTKIKKLRDTISEDNLDQIRLYVKSNHLKLGLSLLKNYVNLKKLLKR